jgi:hypothetical protein
MWNKAMSRGRRAFTTLLVLLFTGCAEGEPMVPPDSATAATVDACGGRCTEVELCVQDRESQWGCARICANQLRCWSGCCLPLGDTGYNVCRPTNYCYAE